jgi:hypothetical protein
LFFEITFARFAVKDLRLMKPKSVTLAFKR